jgi:hypothetical protein
MQSGRNMERFRKNVLAWTVLYSALRMGKIFSLKVVVNLYQVLQSDRPEHSFSLVTCHEEDRFLITNMFYVALYVWHFEKSLLCVNSLYKNAFFPYLLTVTFQILRT